MTPTCPRRPVRGAAQDIGTVSRDLSTFVCPLRGFVLDPPDPPKALATPLGTPLSPRPSTLSTRSRYWLSGASPRPASVARSAVTLSASPIHGAAPTSASAMRSERAQPGSPDRSLDPVHGRWVQAGPPGEGALAESGGDSGSPQPCSKPLKVSDLPSVRSGDGRTLGSPPAGPGRTSRFFAHGAMLAMLASSGWLASMASMGASWRTCSSARCQ